MDDDKQPKELAPEEDLLGHEPETLGPARWGPASHWRLGVAALAVLILLLLIFQFA